jgi:hypothetical protein
MLVLGIALGSVCYAPSESEASEEKPKCNWAGGSREGVNGIYTSALRKGTAQVYKRCYYFGIALLGQATYDRSIPAVQ